MEIEYSVRRMLEDMVMDNLGMMLNVSQALDQVEDEVC
jgi:hypothetical protein